MLGISRSTDLPQQLLVQTTLKKSGAPRARPAHVGAGRGPVHRRGPHAGPSGALYDALDPLTGPGAVGDGAGLAATPDDVAKAYADSLRYPEPVPTTVLETDALRNSWPSYSRSGRGDQGPGHLHADEPESIIGGLRLQGGDGAIVFAHLVRSDAIALRSPVKLTPSKDLTLLTGIKQITTEAKLTSNRIVAFVIPATGKARVVAASDQVVDGTGR